MDRDEILTLNVEGLKAKLDELGLAKTGNKSILQNRLLMHFGLEREVDDGSDYGEASSVVVGNSATMPFSNFTLRDVQDSVSTFSGDGLPEVGQWIEEFEDCAYAVKWNDLQKFIYGKQLLKGAARTFARIQSGVRNWCSLREALVNEFGRKQSALEVHRILESRKKKPNETLREYLYTLQEIGNTIGLDDESLIEYFIEGIGDYRSNKYVLYGAKSVNELREKILIYEKMRMPTTSSSKGSYKNIVRNVTIKNETKDERRCYKCGEKGHLSNACSSAGVKCFKCQRFGHKSFECVVDVKKENSFIKDSNNKNKVNLHTLSTDTIPPSGRIFKDIEIMGKTVSAFVDTGSDISAIRYDSLFLLGDVDLGHERKTLLGIGGKRITTMGNFTARVSVDNVELDVTFHVVRENDILYSIILGNDIFEKIDMVINSDGATFIYKGDSSKACVEEGVEEISSVFELRGEFGDILHSASEQLDEDLLDIEHLAKNVRVKLENLIRIYKPVRPQNYPVEMKIVLSDDIPVVHRPRRMSYADQLIVQEQVNEWLRESIIQPSCSDYAAPVVLVSKKDGTKRLCCDYRKLNLKIVRDNFPMAVIDDVVQRLQGAKVYTTLDLRNGFFHVPVEPNSRKYTAFVTPNGVYEFLYVPFGISNSPAVFCRYITSVFRDLISDGTLLIYMDDLIIPSESEEEGMVKLERVLETARRNGLNIKWRKCQFLKRKINFLGYIIENSTIRPSEEKTKAVSTYPVPLNQKSVQRFLGLTSYFRRFIPNYAIIARPLSNLLRKNTKFEMGQNEMIAFHQLRNSLVTAPVLKLFNPVAVTEIHTDASMYGYGAVLLQQDSEDQRLHPIEYMSRKTTSTEQKYHSYELEVLAIIEALKKWRIYVLGLKVKIVTDCNAFALTMRKQDVPPRVSRWALFLQDFEYEIEHRSGSKMRHVDALSRISCLMMVDSLRYRVKEAQLQDEWIKAIRKVLDHDSYDDYYVKFDLLYKDPDRELIVIPSSMEQEIIQIAHRQGHFSSKKTQDLVEKSYYIPALKSKVDRVVGSCVECIVSEAKGRRKEGFLTPIDKGDRPLVTYHLDHVGPMEATHKKYNHILVVVDAFSKFVWLYPTRSTGTEEVIERLRRQAAVFGNPERIVTDRGSAFTSNKFEEFCEAENIQHLLIATGVPRGNGQVERIHRIIVPMLTKLCVEKPDSWYKYVDRVQRTINSTPPRSTGVEPFKLLTGLDMRNSDNPDIRRLLDEMFVRELDEERNVLRKEARENILRIQQENRRNFNKGRIPETAYEVGELVAIKRTQFGAGMKLRPKFLGPYRIVKKLQHGRYEVEKVGDVEGSRKCTTVAEYMKKWEPHSGRM